MELCSGVYLELWTGPRFGNCLGHCLVLGMGDRTDSKKPFEVASVKALGLRLQEQLSGLQMEFVLPNGWALGKEMLLVVELTQVRVDEGFHQLWERK